MDLSKLKSFINGKKSYLVAVGAALTAVVAWGDGQISGWALLAALWGAVQAVCLRHGLGTAVADFLAKAKAAGDSK